MKVLNITRTFSGEDLRITGSKLQTGCSVKLSNGKTYKVYMTNNTKCCQCYIMLKGKRTLLLNDQVCGDVVPNRLIQYMGWYLASNE